MYVLVGLFMGVAIGAFIAVGLYVLWETQQVLTDLRSAVMDFALMAKKHPQMMEEAISSLTQIQRAVDVQAKRGRYQRPARRAGEEEAPAAWQSPMDEVDEVDKVTKERQQVRREGAEVGNN